MNKNPYPTKDEMNDTLSQCTGSINYHELCQVRDLIVDLVELAQEGANVIDVLIYNVYKFRMLAIWALAFVNMKGGK